MGYGVLVGIDAIRDAALILGARNPLAHIVTNIVIRSADDDAATVRSKANAINVDSTCSTATYADILRRQPNGWRISHRRIVARSEPLGGHGFDCGRQTDIVEITGAATAAHPCRQPSPRSTHPSWCHPAPQLSDPVSLGRP